MNFQIKAFRPKVERGEVTDAGYMSGEIRKLLTDKFDA